MKKIKLILGIVAFMFMVNVNAQTFIIQGAASPSVNLISDDVNDTVCFGTNVTFTTPAEGGTTYEYELDGVTVQGPAASNIYMDNTMSANMHELVVIADNGSCSTTDTIHNFGVLPDINPGITNDDGGIVCLGYETVFRATGVNAVTYDFRVNFVSVQSGIIDTFAVSTLIDSDVVDVVIGDGACTSTSITLTFQVLTKP